MSGFLLRLRWRIAPQLNRLPGFCWADLVMWANGNDRVLPERSQSMCRADVARCGACYCGKLRDVVASCVETASCEDGDHTRTWPCDYAPGTGALAEVTS